MVCIKPVMHIMASQVTSSRRVRREHSPELKRELVERCARPGASVSAIALEAGINANLLFAWRRAHRAAMAEAPTLLPVTIEAASEESCQPVPAAARAVTGTIEIDIGRARLRLRGAVDECSLRCTLQTLHALA